MILSNAGSGNDVSLVNSLALQLGASSISGNLTLTAGGSITQTGAIDAGNGTVTVAVTASSSDILFDTQANDLGSNPLVFSGTLSNIRDVGINNTNSGAVAPSFVGLSSLRNLDLIFTGNNIVLPVITLHNGGDSSQGNLSVVAKGVAGGAITQTGSLIIPGTASFTATTVPLHNVLLC